MIENKNIYDFLGCTDFVNTKLCFEYREESMNVFFSEQFQAGDLAENFIPYEEIFFEV